MGDMFDSGSYVFKSWQSKGFDRWLGKFNLTVSGVEANRLLDHVGKITESGQDAFIRGFENEKNIFIGIASIRKGA